MMIKGKQVLTCSVDQALTHDFVRTEASGLDRKEEYCSSDHHISSTSNYSCGALRERKRNEMEGNHGIMLATSVLLLQSSEV